MKNSHDVSTIENVQRWIVNRRCSVCWEGLVYDEASETVTCITPGCQCLGVIHVQTVLARELESRQRLALAQRSLHKAGYQVPGYNPEEHTQAALLKQLGF